MSNLALATAREVEIVEAAKRLGVADLATLHTFWHDEWYGANRQNLVASTGTTVADPARVSCVLTSTGATAGSLAGFYLLEMGGAPLGVPSGTGGEWYWSCRAMVTTSIDAQTMLSGYAGNIGGGDYLVLGVVGTGVNAGGSTTKYAGWAVANGSPILSTVSIDAAGTAFRIFRMWRKSGVTSFSVDGETAVTGNTYPTAHAGHGSAASNGTTAANSAITTDWTFSASVRPTS